MKINISLFIIFYLFFASLNFYKSDTIETLAKGEVVDIYNIDNVIM